MKTLIIFVLLAFIAFPAEAQGYSSMTQEQLNYSLEKAKSKISTGITLTILGSIATIGGTVLYMSGLNGMVYDDTTIESDTNKAIGGLFVMLGGMGMLGAGIPIWITGNNKKEKVEIQLLKFKGSASALGVGLKITF